MIDLWILGIANMLAFAPILATFLVVIVTPIFWFVTDKEFVAIARYDRYLTKKFGNEMAHLCLFFLSFLAWIFFAIFFTISLEQYEETGEALNASSAIFWLALLVGLMFVARFVFRLSRYAKSIGKVAHKHKNTESDKLKLDPAKWN